MLQHLGMLAFYISTILINDQTSLISCQRTNIIILFFFLIWLV